MKINPKIQSLFEDYIDERDYQNTNIISTEHKKKYLEEIKKLKNSYIMYEQYKDRFLEIYNRPFLYGSVQFNKTLYPGDLKCSNFLDLYYHNNFLITRFLKIIETHINDLGKNSSRNFFRINPEDIFYIYLYLIDNSVLNRNKGVFLKLLTNFIKKKEIKYLVQDGILIYDFINVGSKVKKIKEPTNKIVIKKRTNEEDYTFLNGKIPAKVETYKKINPNHPLILLVDIFNNINILDMETFEIIKCKLYHKLSYKL